MAETKSNQSEKGRDALARRGPSGVHRWGGSFGDPLEFMNRMSEEMDRTFDQMWHDFGFPPRRSSFPGRLFGGRSQQDVWAPRIEAFQKGDRFTVRAELPGLKKDDVQVELTEDALTIRGERREEHEDEREGYFHSEREYGSFQRTIPLPEGVIGESAEAAFRDGVLEVTMQAAPREASRGRRIEVRGAAESERKK